MKMIESDLPIHFLDPNPAGSQVVLFLHGLGADKYSWRYQLDAFAKAGLRPMAVDIPGFGESQFVGRRWTIGEISHRLRLFDKLYTDQAIDLIGLSMGGVIAQQMALDEPVMIRRLVLVDTFATLRPNSVKTWLYLIKRFSRAVVYGHQKQAELVAWHIFPRPEQDGWRRELIRCIEQADPVVYKAAMHQLAMFDSRRKLQQLSMPVLVIGGADDRTVSVAEQTRLANGIKGAKQIVVENAGHALPIDQPEFFNQAVLDWLKSGSI